MAGIYVHIPFCKQACYYCDFHFSTSLALRDKILLAIANEIGLQRAYLKEEDEIQTIYFGGGTPSILSGKEIRFILDTIYDTFLVSPDAEVTLEANPDDLSTEKLRELKNTGINRLSIGIQSFDDVILKSLNRAHDSQLAKSCVNNAYEIGFQNISIDLIYAIPQQDHALWNKNIEMALALRPQHISSYALTIEEKTVFGRWAAKGKIETVDDDFAASQLQILVDRLEIESYEQYEISNFSKPGFHSRHNSNYWKDKAYLGVGPSAHSYNRVSRQYNVLNNYSYVRSIAALKIPATLEILTREDKINEYLLTTLRTSWGSNLAKLRAEFGFDLEAVHGPYIRSLLEHKFAFIENETLLLTKKGRLLADKIASDLFIIP
ncbi:MAG: radical SAM family heme chaperone HemW [Cyclobacteriaceae bacterium]|nr:radical SAM family heme chaperone HemW [Cyclobacteriaceae bacterium]MDH4294724.1 radical SAM family heme chaperone HemW [Cyclobacteriaceae bacterium]MDH5247558.1 radical SAM family heme chaperone HemW [Cyclobacteriaceae bacterium]